MAAILLSAPLAATALPALAMGGHPKACCVQMSGLCGSQLRGSQTCCVVLPSGALQQTPNYSPTHPENANPLAHHSAVSGEQGLPVFAVDFFGHSNSPPVRISVLKI